jgi:hypothetical protein
VPALDERVLAAWHATAWFHEPGAPAAPGALESAEEAIGRRLPDALRELYVRHDGGSWLGGDLTLAPLLGDELSVARASAPHRGWDWPVPDEVVVFGSDGGGDPFGLWLADGARPLVVHIGAIFEPGSMGIAGEDVNAFLRAWTAYYLLLPDREATTAGLDALGLPDHLRSDDPDEETFAQIMQWASPSIDASLHDPYEALLTADDVRRIADAD